MSLTGFVTYYLRDLPVNFIVLCSNDRRPKQRGKWQHVRGLAVHAVLHLKVLFSRHGHVLTTWYCKTLVRNLCAYGTEIVKENGKVGSSVLLTLIMRRKKKTEIILFLNAPSISFSFLTLTLKYFIFIL